MGVPSDRLETVARIVAAQATGLDHDDVRQEITIRFFEKPPACLRAAWTMAHNVRNDIWRRERKHWHADLDGLRNVAAPHESTGTQDWIDGMMQGEPDKTLWLLSYYRHHRHSGTDRATAHHYRKQLRKALLARHFQEV